MARAQVTRRFNMSADDLWAMIGDFGNTGKWSGRPPEACIQEGEGIGALRTLTVEDGRVIVDRLDAQGQYFYSYSIVTSPLPVKSYSATMSVASLSNATCEFTWTGDIDPDGIDNEQATQFFENVYHMGIGLMERQIAQLENKE